MISNTPSIPNGRKTLDEHPVTGRVIPSGLSGLTNRNAADAALASHHVDAMFYEQWTPEEKSSYHFHFEGFDHFYKLGKYDAAVHVIERCLRIQDEIRQRIAKEKQTNLFGA